MSATTTSNQPVPMLDVNRQNQPLQAEVDAALAEVTRSGAFVHGPACGDLETAIAGYCGSKYAIGCASGSDALLLALMALEIGPGDEVILPSFTFFATAGAVWRLGATPVFADILPDTFNLDPAEVAKKITSATKAVLPVHLFGQCAEMDALSEACGDIPIIEDAAQAIGADYHGKRAGSLGQIGCFSFYPTKNLGGFGDGGMLTTDDEQIADKLRVLRDHGQRPRYHHSLVGVNSRLDTLQAAVLGVKLPRLDDWAASRQRHADHYVNEFDRLGFNQQSFGASLTLPVESPGCTSVWNQFTVRVPGGRRDALQSFLQEREIGSAIYYPVPLHRQKCFLNLGYAEGSLPVTEQAAEEVLSLPVFPELTRREQDRVIAALAEFSGIAYVPSERHAA
ncbi:DegT/DnrJ/EryC1/StrS family aminotransferase [Adhaeretor mobilis]|uniref:Aminotransferase n=1 Tax=Adhaeretor mobilis TaxID=1930276 RepID=A0A517N2D3_9BACT|nr:DegT/DnrJ/EryC1/StrS family aminotransferase [Adhaeretor mobilis]QDT01294.1 Aminotransferase [Adhaeretor mobilis]